MIFHRWDWIYLLRRLEAINWYRHIYIIYNILYRYSWQNTILIKKLLELYMYYECENLILTSRMLFELLINVGKWQMNRYYIDNIWSLLKMPSLSETGWWKSTALHCENIFRVYIKEKTVNYTYINFHKFLYFLMSIDLTIKLMDFNFQWKINRKYDNFWKNQIYSKLKMSYSYSVKINLNVQA